MDIIYGIFFLGLLSLLTWFVYRIKVHLILKGLLYFAGLYILFTGTVLYLIFIKPSFRENEFDQQAWFNDQEKRFEMADNLCDENLLIGKDSTEVKLLLGAPQSPHYPNWIYNTGTGGVGLGFGFYYLHVNFKEGKVEDCKTSVYID